MIPVARRRSFKESDIQTAIVTHFRRTYEGEICRVGNGGEKKALAKIRAAGEGEVAGHPDLVIYTPGPTTILMEVKTETGTLSQQQKSFHRRLQNMGFVVVTVHSLDEAKRAFVDLNIPPRQPRERSEAELTTGF